PAGRAARCPRPSARARRPAGDGSSPPNWPATSRTARCARPFPRRSRSRTATTGRARAVARIGVRAWSPLRPPQLMHLASIAFDTDGLAEVPAVFDVDGVDEGFTGAGGLITLSTNRCTLAGSTASTEFPSMFALVV